MACYQLHRFKHGIQFVTSHSPLNVNIATSLSINVVWISICFLDLSNIVCIWIFLLAKLLNQLLHDDLAGLTGEFCRSKLFILVAWNLAEFGIPSPQAFLAHNCSRLGFTRPSIIAKSIKLDYLTLEQSYPLSHLQPLEWHENFDAL